MIILASYPHALWCDEIGLGSLSIKVVGIARAPGFAQ